MSSPARLSLWLLPPSDHDPITTKLQTLITTTIPALFPNERFPIFAPHVTLAVGITASLFAGRTSQDWLDSLDLAAVTAGNVRVRLGGVGRGTTFTKKVFVRAMKEGGLLDLEGALQRAIFGRGSEEVLPARNQRSSVVTARRKTRLVVKRGRMGVKASGWDGVGVGRESEKREVFAGLFDTDVKK